MTSARKSPRSPPKKSNHKLRRKNDRKTPEKTPLKKKSSKSRSYSDLTLKILFGLSSNQCAHPECTNSIVAAGTESSSPAVIGQICHIYAAADNGPRGKPSLTPKERNAFENLLLMCGVHHPLADKQWADFPATLLIRWKAEHEAKATPETAKASVNVSQHVFFQAKSNESIVTALHRLRAARHLVGFRLAEETNSLATQVEETFSSASGTVRAQALAWCARLLAKKETLTKAISLLERSRELATTPEGDIAETFIIAVGDMVAAKSALARIASPAARSAAFRIITLNQGVESALKWAREAALSIDSFDPEGKLALIYGYLETNAWDEAYQASVRITEADISDAPTLLHPVALAHLLQPVPEQYRYVVLRQIPLEAREIQLASTPLAIAALRTARSFFRRLSELARSYAMTDAANAASDYALWIGLRDRKTFDECLVELHESMREPLTALRRVNLAIRFGLKVDLARIERFIDQRIALAGVGTVDDAAARLAIAFAKGTPRAAADYIDQHRVLLYEHLPRPIILGFEVEFLGLAGFTELAKTRLEEAKQAGLTARDRVFLDSRLREFGGSDAITQRQELFETSGDLRALDSLVGALEDAQRWEELLPYAERLFNESPSLDAFQRLVICLQNLRRPSEIIHVMNRHPTLVEQKEDLKILSGWAFYNEGLLDDAQRVLQSLSTIDTPNARALRVNIAIASGAWELLPGYVQSVWEKRDQFDARDLLRAAQIAIALKGPHSRELVIAAAAAAPTDPQVLAACYNLATRAGWEQTPEVAQWLQTAANLSGSDGPVRSVPLQEVIDQQPKWTQQANSTSEQLTRGLIPTFAASQVLRRTLLEFFMLPSISNIAEPDVRRRSIVFAYSGTRSTMAAINSRRVALDFGAIATFARLGILALVLRQFEVVIPHATLAWLFQEKLDAVFHQPSRIRDASALQLMVSNRQLAVSELGTATDENLARDVGEELAALLTRAQEINVSGGKAAVVRPFPVPKVGAILSENADLGRYEPLVHSCSDIVDLLKLKGMLTHKEEQLARSYLQLHERPWPTQTAIEDGAELFLDGLAVTYLQTTGLLSKLRSAGTKAWIAKAVEDEAAELVNIGRLNEALLENIESMRISLTSSLNAGQTRIAPGQFPLNEEDELVPLAMHPTTSVLSIADVDAIVVDDRFVNQHATLTQGSRSVPLLCSLDIVEALRSSRALPIDDYYAVRTSLRQFGYQLVPLTPAELEYHLDRGTVLDGAFRETAELRAIRESLLRARLSAIAQIPSESPFLLVTFEAVLGAIKTLWLSRTPADAASVADYLLGLLNIRAWTPAGEAQGRAFIMHAYSTYILRLCTPANALEADQRKHYLDWVAREILEPVRDYQPELYAWILERARDFVVQSANDVLAHIRGNSL